MRGCICGSECVACDSRTGRGQACCDAHLKSPREGLGSRAAGAVGRLTRLLGRGQIELIATSAIKPNVARLIRSRAANTTGSSSICPRAVSSHTRLIQYNISGQMSHSTLLCLYKAWESGLLI